MTEEEPKIFISGNLKGLFLETTFIEELIDCLLEAEPRLGGELKTKPINIAFMGSEQIKALNFRFADKDKPTNVLSFPSKGVDFGDESLGDIAICPEIIIKEAIDQGKEKQNHLTHIILHSLLHLVGYVHEDNNSASRMESLEVMVLKKLGIANPY